MTEDKQHQLDELKLSDILSYCVCRAFTTEEYIRGANKQIDTLIDRLNKKSSQLAKVKFALRNVIDYLGQFCPDCPDCVIEAEQLLMKEAEE